MPSLLLKFRRAETPFFRGVRKFARRVESSRLPLPGFFNPFLGFCYNAWQTASVGFHWLYSYLFVEPLFRGRCASVGKRLRVWRLPFILGHA
jgi:hypothetical protein